MNTVSTESWVPPPKRNKTRVTPPVTLEGGIKHRIKGKVKDG